MPLEYNYRAGNGDSVQGLRVPNTDERTFPDDLISIFVSNSAYTERAINLRPLNTVDVFICFESKYLFRREADLRSSCGERQFRAEDDLGE